MLFPAHSGKFPHSYREQEGAICETERKMSESVGYQFISCVMVASIILGDPIPKEPCELSILFFQGQLKEGLLNFADYCQGLCTKT